MTDPWCVIGNFNNVLEPEDRIGGQIVTVGEIRECKSCIQDCELQDIVATGGTYTWNNR